MKEVLSLREREDEMNEENESILESSINKQNKTKQAKQTCLRESCCFFAFWRFYSLSTTTTKQKGRRDERRSEKKEEDNYNKKERRRRGAVALSSLPPFFFRSFRYPF